MQIQIRKMEHSDLGRGGEILFQAFHKGAVRHGYPPRIHTPREGTSWAWTLLRHHPAELLIAEAEGRAAGVACLNPRGEHAGLGPVAVDPSFQGNGVGRRLMTELLERGSGLKSVRLFQEAFNPASFSLYHSLQFIPVADLLDLVRKGGDRIDSPPGTIEELTENELDEVCSYDLPRSRLDRRNDLSFFLKWGKVFVRRSRSRIRGFLAALPTRQSVQLGPMVADGERDAISLFQHADAAFRDQTCQTRVMARDDFLVRVLQRSGFRLYCIDLLMVRGEWRPGPYTEAFGRFPEGA